MIKFYSQYNIPARSPEEISDEIILEETVDLSIKEQVERLIKAGERLRAYQDGVFDDDEDFDWQQGHDTLTDAIEEYDNYMSAHAAENPVEENPVEEKPVEENPVEENPVEEKPEKNSAAQQPKDKTAAAP